MAAVVLSLLPLLTVSALALLVPATLIMLSGRHGRHSAVAPGNERWVLLAVAAVAVVSGAFAGALALGTGPATAAVSAGTLGAVVLAWAPLTRTWPVTGVTVWALVVATAGGLVASATAAALSSSVAWTGAAVSAAGAALLVPGLGSVHRRLRAVLGVRAGARKLVRLPVYLRPWLLRPAIALGVFVTAFSVTGLTGDGIGADEAGAREAGPGAGTGVAEDGSPSRLVSSTSRTPSATPTGAGPTAGPGARAERGATDLTGTVGGPDESAPVATRTLRTPSAGTGTEEATVPAGSDVGNPGGSNGDTTDAPTAGPSATEPTQSSPVETVTGTVEEVTEPVAEVVDDVTDPVQDATEPVTDTVEEVTEPVTEPVEEVTEPVTEVVDEVTEPVQDVTEPVTSLLP